MWTWKRKRNRPEPAARFHLRERMLRDTEMFLTYELRAEPHERIARRQRDRWTADRFRCDA